MIYLYEKTCKTKNIPYGIKEVKEENPFKLGPCVITILAYPIYLKDINGSLRQIAELINPNIDHEYDKERRMFGIGFGNYNEQTERFSKYSPDETELEEFMNIYIYPLISTNSNKINLILAMKNIRNLTFVTYCNGTKAFKLIEEKLERKMKILGYNNHEIGLILSQICLASISGMIMKKKGTKSLNISFGDISDMEFEKNKKNISTNLDFKDGLFIQYDNSIAFVIDGDGEHSLKKHMTQNEILSKEIAIFLNTSLDNAILNKYSDTIIPITYEKMDNALTNNKNKTLIKEK